MKALKVLFLDIDGVLNSTRSCIANRGYPFDFSPEHMAMFDHIAVAMIRGLCAAGGVSIVVSSAWRSRTMVPICPHCREAVFAEDNFGSSAVSREIAIRRRQVSLLAPKAEGVQQ